MIPRVLLVYAEADDVNFSQRNQGEIFGFVDSLCVILSVKKLESQRVLLK